MSRQRRGGQRGVGYAPDAVVALSWAGFGVWNAAATSEVTAAVAAIVILTSAGVGLARWSPAAALALVWVAGGIQALSVSDVLGGQAGVLVVAYGTARYGRRLTVWLGGLSVPLGAALGEYYVFTHSTVLPSAIDVATPLLRHTGLGVVSAFLLATAGLGLPWAFGLALRFNARYRRAAMDRAQAQARASEAELSNHLRAEQVQLARDVHDLVGHSLAVIIAQADAARIAAGGPVSPVRDALANIAAVARSSLSEVRQVLLDTRERSTSSSSSTSTSVRSLHALVDSSRAAGHDVQETTHGSPIGLTAPTQAALYRVLQEMLTNAIKHGRPGRPIGLVHTWAATSYSLSVTNVARPVADHPLRTDANGTDANGTGGKGMGVDGMRARLEQIDGTLVLSSTGDADCAVFTTTACIPVAESDPRR